MSAPNYHQQISALRRRINELEEINEYFLHKITEVNLMARFALSVIRVKDPNVPPPSLIVGGKTTPPALIDGYEIFTRHGGREKMLEILEGENYRQALYSRAMEVIEGGDTRAVEDIVEELRAADFEAARIDRGENGEGDGGSDSQSDPVSAARTSA